MRRDLGLAHLGRPEDTTHGQLILRRARELGVRVERLADAWRLTGPHRSLRVTSLLGVSMSDVERIARG